MVGDGREGSHGQSLKILVVLGERFAKHRDDSWRWGEYHGNLEVSCVLSRPNSPRVGRIQLSGPRVDSCGCGVGTRAASGMCPDVLPVT